MRKLFAVAVAATVVFGFIVPAVYGMDARPIASKLPPVASRLGAIPHFVGPIAPADPPRWRVHARVYLGFAAQDSYTYNLHADFDDEDSCKAFVGSDRDFRDAIAVLVARGRDVYGHGAFVEITCERV